MNRKRAFQAEKLASRGPKGSKSWVFTNIATKFRAQGEQKAVMGEKREVVWGQKWWPQVGLASEDGTGL